MPDLPTSPATRPLPDPHAQRILRRAMVLLATMTSAVAAGPVAIGVVLRGGRSPGWPPDRAVEWAMFVGVSAGVVALLVLCVALALANQRAMRHNRPSPDAPPPPPADLDGPRP